MTYKKIYFQYSIIPAFVWRKFGFHTFITPINTKTFNKKTFFNKKKALLYYFYLCSKYDSKDIFYKVLDKKASTEYYYSTNGDLFSIRHRDHIEVWVACSWGKYGRKLNLNSFISHKLKYEKKAI